MRKKLYGVTEAPYQLEPCWTAVLALHLASTSFTLATEEIQLTFQAVQLTLGGRGGFGRTESGVVTEVQLWP